MRKLINTEERTDTVYQEDDIKVLVEKYIENKDQETHYKNLASAENTQIKEMMATLNINKVDTAMGSAIVSEQKRENFIEDLLIDFLKKNGKADGIVKTKEYVDYDALESAIYNEKIPADMLSAMAVCKEVKTVKVLRIKKKGEK